MSNEGTFTSERIAVPASFEEVFSHFYVARNASAHAIHKTLLPSFQTIMVFSFGTPVIFTSPQGTTIDISTTTVIGPIKRPIEYTLPAGVDMLVVNFKSDGFYRFFGQAVIDSPVPVHPDDLIGDNCFTGLWFALKEKNTDDRIAFLLEFARPYIRSNDSTLVQFENQVVDPTLNPIKVIAHETRQSERNIQLKHKKRLGYSAKEKARYQRFLNTIEYLEKSIAQQSLSIDWQDVVARFGYYDQSQLIHDFNHYLNLSPGQFLKFQQDVCVARPQ